tara:strand:- start:13 stop:114 length:102 start_codon:yes stop_codon:yes gene_type:complete
MFLLSKDKFLLQKQINNVKIAEKKEFPGSLKDK